MFSGSPSLVTSASAGRRSARSGTKLSVDPNRRPSGSTNVSPNRVADPILEDSRTKVGSAAKVQAMQLTTRPLDSFGIELVDVRLHNLDHEMIEAIRRAWQLHPLILVRRQSITEAELLDFGKRFGPLHSLDGRPPASRLRPVAYISNLKSEDGERLGALGSSELNWHTDQSYKENPATGSIFYAVEMPANAGKTQWCNTQLAYDALSATERSEVAPLTAWTRYNAFEREPITEEEKALLREQNPPVSHPLVLTHPVTGQKCLYLDISTAYKLSDLSDQESSALIGRLAAVMTRPEFIYTHEWQAGDIVMWDNSRLCHRRDPIKGGAPRLAKRLSIFLNKLEFPLPQTG